MPEQNQFNIYQLIALFLSEIVRSRKTSLRRAAEIANVVVKKIPSLQSETQALTMITDIEKEFEEVAVLRQTLHFGYTKSDIKIFERDIKEFASQIFTSNMVQSATFLQDASKNGITIQELCLKYPDFCNFLSANSDSGKMALQMQGI